jgi:hypothetical protein
MNTENYIQPVTEPGSKKPQQKEDDPGPSTSSMV